MGIHGGKERTEPGEMPPIVGTVMERTKLRKGDAARSGNLASENAPGCAARPT
jgi:hypothetical protein